MNRNVWLLFCCQAMMNAVMSGQVVMASLIGNALSGNKALSTLPVAIQMTAVMAGSIPAGIVFSRLGRRPGFWLGIILALCGSLTFALGVWRHSFLLYCLGAIPAGMGYGIAQHLRFAAAEVAAERARPRAIALVMTGGVVAAVIGPEIVIRTNMTLPDHQFLATYLVQLALPLAAACLLSFIALPKAEPRQAIPVPLGTILARPTFITAAVAAMVGYGAMNLVMTSTPLQMAMCGYGVNEAAQVIRAHSLAMFLPGFLTGRLIQRFGVHRVIGTGGALISLCVIVNLGFAPLFATFTVALILLGVGWNFMFVGGTTLLTSAYALQERVRVQATNDFLVFGTTAITAFASGAIETTGGWGVLNLAVMPPIIIALALVTWHWMTRARLVAVAE
ncbi:MAG: MFS transporter [Acetobacteraceae bacterium]